VRDGRRRRISRTGALVLVLLMVVAAGAGCGRLSKKDYVTKANAICRQTNATVAKQPVPNKADVGATAEYLRDNATLLTTEANQIDALKAPKQDAPRLHDVFNRQRDGLSILQTAANQFALGDSDLSQATANNANTELNTVKQDLQAYGLTDCAS
jgi:hypothetical protein